MDTAVHCGATMLAARAYRGDHEFRLERIAVPEPGRDEVVVRVKAASLTRGLLAVWYFTDLMRCLPSVLGHEIAGVVEAAGAGVHRFERGDRVAVHTPLACGSCRFCRTGRESLCVDLGTIGHGFYGRDGALGRYKRYHDGGLAEFIRVPATSLMPLPEAVSFVAAARLPTLASSFRVVKLTGVTFGDSLVVTGGTGSSGAAAVKCAPLLGVTRVIAVARRRAALDRLAQVTDVEVLPIATDELPPDWMQTGALTERVLALTGGVGADGVADFTPEGTAVTTQCIGALRHGGGAVLIAGNRGRIEIDYLRLMQAQWKIRGFRGVLREDECELLALMGAGRLDAEPLVTHRFPLKRVNEAIATIFNRVGAPIFVVITP
jgi:threonine dehydrogenase-like Zn-dependent dehydrogenase